MKLLALLRQQLKNHLPFVGYRKPNATRLQAYTQSDARLHLLTDYESAGFVIAPFTAGTTWEHSGYPSVLFPEAHCERHSEPAPLSKPELYQQDASTGSKPLGHDEDAKEAHIDLVRNGINFIKSGEAKKIVLARKLRIPSDSDPLNLFERLLYQYPTAMVYCWYHPKIGLWLGATPETLLSVKHQNLRTMALAGTQRDSGTLEVEWGDKEKEEQHYVTEAILSGLSPHVVDLKIQGPVTHKAGKLLHLKTDIEAQLPEGGPALETIIKVLHPTPAVCGLPRMAAFSFIQQAEHFDRGYYTGFLGELNSTEKRQRSQRTRNVENQAYRSVSKTTDLYVNLRCLEHQKSVVTLYVGGGITAQSDPEAEWMETVRKATTMQNVL